MFSVKDIRKLVVVSIIGACAVFVANRKNQKEARWQDYQSKQELPMKMNGNFWQNPLLITEVVKMSHHEK